MRVAPVSADLLVKLAIGGALVLAAVWATRAAAAGAANLAQAAADAAGKAWDTATDAAYSVAPWNQENVIYGTVNRIGVAVINPPSDGPGMNADGSWTLGGWLQDVTHPATAAAVRGMSGPVNTGAATGEW